MLTLLTHPTNPPPTAPYSLADAGVCVDLFGTGKTETVDLAKCSAVNCLSAYIWRDPDFNTGLFQLFDTASGDPPSTNATGPRTTFFLSEWSQANVQSLAGWEICDASDIIYFSGLNAQSVVLYDDTKGDGAHTGSYSGWFTTTYAFLKSCGFTNRASGWRWTLLKPLFSTVDEVSINIAASDGSSTPFSQTSTGKNNGNTTLVQKATYQDVSSQTITTMVSQSVTTGYELSESITTSCKETLPGVESSVQWTLSVKLTQSMTESTSTTNSFTTTQSITQELDITVPEYSSWTAQWVVQTCRMQPTAFTTKGKYYYNVQVPGSVEDPAMEASLKTKPVYRLEATVTGTLSGSLAAQTNVVVTTLRLPSA